MNPSAEEIIETTRQVLSQEEFQQNPPWEARLLIDFINWLLNNDFAMALLKILFYSAIALFVTFLVWLLFREILQVKVPRLFRKKSTSQTVLSAATSPESSNEKLQYTLRDISSCLGWGDNRRAIQFVHGFVIEQLAHQKVLSKRKWKTNSHYVDECSKVPGWNSIFQSLSIDFDRAVYGRAELSDECLKKHLKSIESEAAL